MSRDKLVREAQRLIAKKRYREAIELYRRLATHNPSDVRALLKIGDLYMKVKDHERALSTYEQVGEYYFREGFSVKAIAVYKQIRGLIAKHAEHLQDRYAHILPRLAAIYTELGLTSEAVAVYDELAIKKREQGLDKDALVIFETIVDLDPQNPIAHLRIGDTKLRLKQANEATEHFGKAAELMVKLGRHDDALKVLERLLEAQTSPKWARYAAELYLDRGLDGDGMAALSKLQLCFQADPKDLSTLATLARAFDSIGQPLKAIEVLKESARIAKEQAHFEALAAIVDVLMARAPDDDQVKHWQAHRVAHETGRPPPPDDLEVDVDLNDLSIDESMSEVFELTDGEVNSMIEDVTSMELFAPEVNPKGNGVKKVVEDAEAYSQAGHVALAISALRDGLTTFGDVPPLRTQLVQVLFDSGDLPGATEQKLLLAARLGAENDFEGALAHVTEALTWSPNNSRALELQHQLSIGMSELAPLIEDGQSVSVQVREHKTNPLPDDVPDAPPSRSRTGTIPMIDAMDPDESGVETLEEVEAEASPPSFDQAPTVAPPEPTMDEILELAETLAREGQFERAREVLLAELHRKPAHPIILAHLDELRQQQAHARDGDTTADLADIHELPASESSPGSTTESVNQEHVHVLTQVKKNITTPQDNVGADDHATHYELAVGYREMGQYDQAIASFRLAAQDPTKQCVCLYLISCIQLERGQQDAALDSLHQALAVQHRTRDEELMVGYEIGHIYAAREMPEQALQYFEWVALVYPDHDDARGSVTERIQQLRGGSGPLRVPLSRSDEADEA